MCELQREEEDGEEEDGRRGARSLTIESQAKNPIYSKKKV